MADLLDSLLTVSRSSEESFRSTYSDLQTLNTLPGLDATREHTSQNPVSSRSVPQAVHDVDTFLNDPANQAIMEGATSPKYQPGPSQTSTLSVSDPLPIEPVQLGTTKSSHHVARFYQLCQERRYTPVFQVEESATGSQKFGGRLIIGRETVSIDPMFGSKKEARQVLAEKGCEFVRYMDAKPKPKAEHAGKVENWVGKLTEFHSLTSSPLDPGPSFTEFAVGSSFACEVQIRQSATPLGSRTKTFPNKKSAKSEAAHDAIKYLIATGNLLPDGSIPPHLLSRKKPKLGTAVRAESASGSPLIKSKPQAEKSWGEKVNDLYPMLGLAAPQYKLEPANPITAPTLFSGAAYFPLDVEIIPGPVGEVRHVLGRKRAREECAKGVWMYLEALRRKRLGIEDEDEEE